MSNDKRFKILDIIHKLKRSKVQRGGVSDSVFLEGVAKDFGHQTIPEIPEIDCDDLHWKWNGASCVLVDSIGIKIDLS